MLRPRPVLSVAALHGELRGQASRSHFMIIQDAPPRTDAIGDRGYVGASCDELA